MSPDERRRTLVEATLPLLYEHGRAVTSRQIAEAAGVAEGTIFRAYDSKEALIEAAIAQGLDPGPFVADLVTIDPSLPVHERLVELVSRLQTRFRGIFALMSATGAGPPRHRPKVDREELDRALLDLVEPDRDRFTCEPRLVVHLLRLLTFSGSHPHISDGRPLTAEQVVTTVLDGVLRKGSSRC